MIMTMTFAPRIIGFYTTKGRQVCRDTYCVKMIEARGDKIETIVKQVAWDHGHCDFCGMNMNHA
jgi:hypothetical protein